MNNQKKTELKSLMEMVRIEENQQIELDLLQIETEVNARLEIEDEYLIEEDWKRRQTEAETEFDIF